MKDSILNEARKSIRRLSVSIGFVFFCFSIVGLFLFVNFVVINEAEATFQSNKDFLKQALSLGDKFGLELQMESMTTAEFEGVSIFAIDGEGEVSIIVSKPGPIDYRAESFPLTIKNKQLSYHATFPISESRGKAYYVTLIKPIDTTLIFTWILATLFVTSLIIFFIGYILKLISRNFSRAIEDVVTQIRKFDDVAIPSFRYTESEDLYLKFESQWSQLKDKERQLQDHNKFKAIASTTQYTRLERH